MKNQQSHPSLLVDNDNEVLSVEDLKELIGNIPEVEKKTVVDKSKLEIYKTPVSTRVRKKRWSYPAKEKTYKKDCFIYTFCPQTQNYSAVTNSHSD